MLWTCSLGKKMFPASPFSPSPSLLPPSSELESCGWDMPLREVSGLISGLGAHSAWAGQSQQALETSHSVLLQIPLVAKMLLQVPGYWICPGSPGGAEYRSPGVPHILLPAQVSCSHQRPLSFCYAKPAFAQALTPCLLPLANRGASCSTVGRRRMAFKNQRGGWALAGASQPG